MNANSANIRLVARYLIMTACMAAFSLGLASCGDYEYSPTRGVHKKSSLGGAKAATAKHHMGFILNETGRPPQGRSTDDAAILNNRGGFPYVDGGGEWHGEAHCTSSQTEKIFIRLIVNGVKVSPSPGVTSYHARNFNGFIVMHYFYVPLKKDIERKIIIRVPIIGTYEDGVWKISQHHELNLTGRKWGVGNLTGVVDETGLYFIGSFSGPAFGVRRYKNKITRGYRCPHVILSNPRHLKLAATKGDELALYYGEYYEIYNDWRKGLTYRMYKFPWKWSKYIVE